jgi:hypothetical protein
MELQKEILVLEKQNGKVKLLEEDNKNIEQYNK